MKVASVKRALPEKDTKYFTFKNLLVVLLKRDSLWSMKTELNLSTIRQLFVAEQGLCHKSV